MRDIYVCVIFLRVKIYWMFFYGATFSMFTFRIVKFSCVRFSLTPGKDYLGCLRFHALGISKEQGIYGKA